MTVEQLDARLGPLLEQARQLQTDIAKDEPTAEMAVALGAISVVVVALASLLDTMLDSEVDEKTLPPDQKGN